MPQDMEDVKNNAGQTGPPLAPQKTSRNPLRYIILLLILCLAAYMGMHTYGAHRVMVSMNGLTGAEALPVSEEAQELHKSIFVADLHCDATLWTRDITLRDERGHVDIPRLLEGGVALQGFTAATWIPASQNIDATDEKWDVLVPLTFFQGWPSETWNSPLARALYQAQRVHDAATQTPDGAFRVIRFREDLELYLKERETGANMSAGFLGIEGLHCLEGDYKNVDMLFDAGFRMMAPTHFFDNGLGGSAHGLKKMGITEFGEAVLERMEALGIIVDLAHASPKLIDDTLDRVSRPVLISHTGVRGACDNNRNLSDEQLHRIAAGGGLVGIGFWETAVCGEDVASIVAAIRYTADLLGVQHVCLGSDWDGATFTPFDASDMPQLTQGLLDNGFSKDDVAKIMGGNILQFMLRALPEMREIAQAEHSTQ